MALKSRIQPTGYDNGRLCIQLYTSSCPGRYSHKASSPKASCDDDGDDEDVSDDDDLEFCLFLLPLLLLYTSASEDFLAGLARGATRSALAAELAEAAQAGNAPGVLEARLWESREVWVSRQISDLGFRFRAEVGPRGFMKDVSMV